jgi:aryl-alcohol dehydrogenase-like predicted oxidoreductase
MQKRSLGSLQVSVVGVGCNNFGARLDQSGTDEVVHAALDAGVNFFDNADIYGGTQSEVLLGNSLRHRRDEAIIATKYGMGGVGDTQFSSSPDYIRKACDASLARLGVEYIDLYQWHFPDGVTAAEDMMAALHDLIDAGKIREIGCSNLTAAQLREYKVAADSKKSFVSVQNQYSLLARDPENDGVLEACDEVGLGFLPYYPLANGWLTGKVDPNAPMPENIRLASMSDDRKAHWHSEGIRNKVSSLLAYAEEINTPLLTLAFSWLLSHRQVASVIAGASTRAQIQANAAAATTLPPEVVAELNRLTA